MQRLSVAITLQYQDTRPTYGIRIRFNDNCGVNASDNIGQNNTIRGQFPIAMPGYLHVPLSNQTLNDLQNIGHLTGYSAASLAPLLFLGLPAAFFSTGPRNFPV